MNKAAPKSPVLLSGSALYRIKKRKNFEIANGDIVNKFHLCDGSIKKT